MLTTPPQMSAFLGKNDAANHCAHFVSHVMQYDFGHTCKNATFANKHSDGIGGTIRVAFLLIFLAGPALADHEMVDAFSGEPVTINPAMPPNGSQLMQILLKQGGAIQRRATPCGSPNDPKSDHRTLLDVIAGTLGFGLIDKQRRVNMVAQCKADKFEFPEGVKDIWSCSLRVTETTKKGSYIASGDLDFGITRDKWEIIPGAFMCM